MTDSSARVRLAGAALIALATTLMLEGMRVFVAYLVFVVDQSQRVELGSIACGVFLSIGLGGVLARRRGPRRALLGGAALCGLARLALQFWEAPTPRVVLGALVVVSWGWLLLAAFEGGLPREAVAQGVPLGLGLDLALRIAFGSLDLPWAPTTAQHVATLLVVGGLVCAGWLVRAVPPGQTSTGSNLSLIGVGPGLAMYHLVSGNLGRVTVELGDWQRAFPLGALILAVGVCGALALTLTPDDNPIYATSRFPYGWRGVAAEVSSLVILLAMLWATLDGFAVLYLVFAFFNVGVLGSVLRANQTPAHPRAKYAALWFTLGMLLQAGLLFGYYSPTGSAIYIYVAYIVLAVAGYLAPVMPKQLERPSRVILVPAALVGSLLALACVWQFATWDTPHAQAGQLGDEFTVMTYNLQSGFARDNHWSLEAQARVIEAQQPDIVILEEVSRGWLVTTGNDELLWLSQRLEMPYVWGPASDDGLWGDAILSRVALSQQDATKFASTANLKRGAVRAQVQTPGGALWIYGTHLDNPSGAGAVRREQVNELLRYIGLNQPAIVGGDLNATPNSDVLAALHSAGFSDYGALLGPGVTTSEDGKRIDYLLLKGRITVNATLVPDVWASDHKPFVLRLRVEE